MNIKIISCFIDYIDAIYPSYCVSHSFSYCKTAIALLYARLLAHYPFWSAKNKWLSRIEDKICVEAIDWEGFFLKNFLSQC